MSPIAIIILAVVGLVLIIVLPTVIVISRKRRRRKRALQQGPIEQKLFIPKGRLAHNQLNHAQPQVIAKAKKGAFTTDHFTGHGQDQTLTGTCFLTGMPELSCTCEKCKEKRKRKGA